MEAAVVVLAYIPVGQPLPVHNTSLLSYPPEPHAMLMFGAVMAMEVSGRVALQFPVLMVKLFKGLLPVITEFSLLLITTIPSLLRTRMNHMRSSSSAQITTITPN